MKQELYKYLSQFVLERRLELFEKVISFRTRYITVLLEDVFQAQNTSAVVRTCDCFGIQDIHLVESRNKFKIDREVSMGSHKWLTFHEYKTTRDAIKNLKQSGYRIVAATPGKNDVSLYDFNLEHGKVAILFGTELSGLSDYAIENADEFISIPMYGFTESYNISVSVALIIQFLVKNLHSEEKISWKLSDDERIDILISWLEKSIRNVELIEKKFQEDFKLKDSS